MAQQAKSLLASLGVSNARVIEAAHAGGAPAEAPFDSIVVGGQIPAAPASLLSQLAQDGRLVAVVGERAVATAMLYTRHGEATSARPAFEAAVRRLPGFVAGRPAFVF